MIDAPKSDAAKSLGKGPLEEEPLVPKRKKFGGPAGTGKHLGRGIMLAALFITFAWVFASLTQPRYVLAPVNSNDNSFMYRLDQRTGVMHLCSSQQCTELTIR